ncbi:hypothetical protein DIPPA_13935 [Diplonema papillatum]|nr:hypothetical protein DIPPA_13935 [Diplonema papillatum]
MNRPAVASAAAKHLWYQSVVQNGANTAAFIGSAHNILSSGKSAVTLREDFCGTGLISLHWLRTDAARKVVMVDHDPEPVQAGAAVNDWRSEEIGRATICIDDVLSVDAPSDATCALNFSWCAFLEDDQLLRYFRHKKQTTDVLILDLYGGPEAERVGKWPQPCPGGVYVWEHTEWCPSRREVKAAMHFYPTPVASSPVTPEPLLGAFTYHWRLRTPEHTVELIKQAGFELVYLWEEERTPQGQGTGAFRPNPVQHFNKSSGQWSTMITAA